jgi:hypothetical protein
MILLKSHLFAPSPAHHFSIIPELETRPKPLSNHVENIQLATSFDHLKGGAHDLVILTRTVRKFVNTRRKHSVTNIF